MQDAGSPEVEVPLPGAGFERGSVLNDEEGGGIDPYESGEPDEGEGEGSGPGGERFRRGWRRRKPRRSSGDDEAKHAGEGGNGRNGARGGGEQRREVADEVGEAGAESDLEEGAMVA